ncbi:MAG: aspartyl protease family protein [Deltaproteobacteria bacterium]|nr:aspartyl protease family protein [Deltaproteobacteria bacterium]
MGLTFLEIEVGNPANPHKTQVVEFLVDSGVIYSVVPTPVLKKLGIKPIAKEEFILANGEKIVRKKGVAFFRYGEKVGGADVIFGEPEDSMLLGAFTLEALGLMLDPLRRELKPLPMMLARVTSR